MLNITLTGGIACGKSTVAKLFEKLGVYIVDTDDIARDVVKLNSLALKKIVSHFSKNILLQDRTLDRQKLAQIVFANAEELKWLNDLLHPLIYKKLFQLLDQNAHCPYSISIIPLLFETHSQDQFDQVVLVDCDLEKQIERLEFRNNLTKEEALNRIKSQLSREQKLELADKIIFNGTNTSLAQLKNQVEEIHQELLLLKS